MLTPREEQFIEWWRQNREREKKLMRQLFVGLPLGALISGGILIAVGSGWYTRANMEANTELNPVVFIVAIIAITVFTAIFYKKTKWDMNEQRYRELIAKKQKETESDATNP